MGLGEALPLHSVLQHKEASAYQRFFPEFIMHADAVLTDAERQYFQKQGTPKS
jgi:hypothetical protein